METRHRKFKTKNKIINHIFGLESKW